MEAKSKHADDVNFYKKKENTQSHKSKQRGCTRQTSANQTSRSHNTFLPHAKEIRKKALVVKKIFNSFTTTTTKKAGECFNLRSIYLFNLYYSRRYPHGARWPNHMLK